MKTNMLILVIPSLIAFILLCMHMVKTKGWRFLLSFVGAGLFFGFLRARIINFIQIDLNHSVIPYQFAGKLLRIGNDSLVVYLGWIIVAYIAWQLAERIIKKVDDTKSGHIFPIISLAFFIIAALSYANETAASVAKWWNWNEFLVAGFNNSLFVNVPWVGILDWGTVSFEFLAIFLLIPTIFKEKKYWYTLILLLPIAHWGSHINSWVGMIGRVAITPSLTFHLALPLIALLFWFLPGPNEDYKDVRNFDRYLFGAIGIIILVCSFAEIYYGKDSVLLISLLPLLIFLIMSLVNIKLKSLYILGIGISLLALLAPNTLTEKRIIFALYPIALFAIIELLSKIPFAKLRQIPKKTITGSVIIIFFFLLVGGYIIVNNHTDQRKATGEAKAKSKVILITLDTVPSNHVGVYGYKKNTTINFDRFAKENTLFGNAYTPVPYTYPAHYSIFTGLYPNHTNIITNLTRFSNPESTLNPIARQFHADGYKTAAFLSSYILNSQEMRNGFDRFDVGNMHPAISTSDKGVTDQRSGLKTNEVVFPWIEENQNDGFFAWIHYYDAHSPYVNICNAPDFVGSLKPDNPNLVSGDVPELAKSTGKFSPNDINYLSARYDQDLFCSDKALGELLTYLKKINLYEDTTIIIAGDHGENFDHNTIFHGENLYQSAIKVPLAIKSAEIKKGVINEPVSLVDIYPTLSKLFWSKELQVTSDGVSLTESLNKERAIFFETTKTEPTTINTPKRSEITQIGILKNNKKMLKTLVGNIFEIYAINTDPEELTNLKLSKPDLRPVLENFFKS